MTKKGKSQSVADSEETHQKKSLSTWIILGCLTLVLAGIMVLGVQGETDFTRGDGKEASFLGLVRKQSGESKGNIKGGIAWEGELIDGQKFLDQELLQVSFKKSALIGQQEESERKGGESSQIRGGVVPHFLPAGFVIADFFRRLGENQKPPETVIILGPNHQEQGDFPVLTTRSGWQTSQGLTLPDTFLIERLVEKGLAQENQDVLENEHAIGVLIPFIQHYLPESRIIPLVISKKMTLAEVRLLSQELTRIAQEEEVVLVASVDFSHYLTQEVAQEKDRETLEIFKAQNYQGLMELGSDHLDSPAALVTLMLTMKQLGEEKPVIRHQLNSADLPGGSPEKTTSFMGVEYF
jgi:hypothetical protein